MIKNIRNILNKLYILILDENIKKTFESILKFNYKYKIIWIILIPFSTTFIITNVIIIIISFFNYFLIFCLKLIKIKIFNRKPKNLTYKRRFKYLKNFYLIIIEKIFITFPKQKAFLIFYLISKSIYEKDISFIQKEHLPEFFKSLSNRIIIVIIFSIPYICIYCNTCLTTIIKNLNEYNYENKKAYFNTILINIMKNLSNDYSSLILKLKIKFFKKKMIFNSKKDLIKALYYKKEFGKNFNLSKKYIKYALVKHKIKENKYSKEHFTAINKLENEKIVYLNETTKKELINYKYHKNIDSYTKEIHKNMYYHRGSINEKKESYYTPNIITEKDKFIIINPEYNNKLY